MKTTTALLALMVSLSFIQGAEAQTAKQAPSLPTLDADTEMLSSDADMAEVEGYSFDDIATQTNLEAKGSEKEVRDLKKKIARLEAKKKQSQLRSERAAQRLADSQKRKADAEKQVAKLESEQKAAEAQLGKTQAKVESLKELTQVERNKAKEAKDAYFAAAKHRQQLLRKQKQLQAQTRSYEKQRKSYAAKRLKIADR